MKKIAYASLFFIILIACKDKPKQDTPTPKAQETSKQTTEISFEMSPKSNSKVKGSVTFSAKNGSVYMAATFSGLTPGDHAIHLHETADCSSEDGKSTGGHWNPTFEPHGQWNSETGFHRGDIGNFTADAHGNATLNFSTNLWAIGGPDSNKNILGKAVIVHQGADDLTSQPSGAAGARISCTGIIQ